MSPRAATDDAVPAIVITYHQTFEELTS